VEEEKRTTSSLVLSGKRDQGGRKEKKKNASLRLQGKEGVVVKIRCLGRGQKWLLGRAQVQKVPCGKIKKGQVNSAGGNKIEREDVCFAGIEGYFNGVGKKRGMGGFAKGKRRHPSGKGGSGREKANVVTRKKESHEERGGRGSGRSQDVKKKEWGGGRCKEDSSFPPQNFH